MTENENLMMRYINSLEKDSKTSWAMPLIISTVLSSLKGDADNGRKPSA